MSFTAERTVHVTVRNAAGEKLELALAVGPHTHLGQVKSKVATTWGVHPRFQRLSIGGETLGDEAPLLPWCQGGGSDLIMSMTFMIEAAMAAMKASDAGLRVFAVEALGRQESEQHSERVLLALVTSLQDEAAEVRRRAVKALASYSQAGDIMVRRSLLGCLRDPHVAVRRAALDALAGSAATASCMDEVVLDAIVDLWADDDVVLRGLAVDAFVRVGNDTQVMDAVRRSLGHSEPDVREAALEVLGRRHKRGEEHALELVMPSLEDEDWAVRRSAVKALGKVARIGDGVALGLLMRTLEDPEQFVRITVVQALGVLAPPGRDGAIPELLQGLSEDDDGLVRHAAQSALDTLQAGCRRAAGGTTAAAGHSPTFAQCGLVK